MRSKAVNFVFYILGVLTIIVSVAWVRSTWWAGDMVVLYEAASNGADLAFGSGRGQIGLTLAFYDNDYYDWISYESSEPGPTVWFPKFEWWYPHAGIGFDVSVPDWLLILLFGAMPTARIIRIQKNKCRIRRQLNLCQKCGYDLRGTVAADRTECPECGCGIDEG